MDKKGFTILPPFIKDFFIKSIERPVDFFIRLNIHPNFFTILGLIASCIGAYFFAVGNLRLGGIFILIGGISDTLDGKIARKTGRSTKFGAVFDSSLDRYAEFAMFLGILIHLLQTQHFLYTATAIVAFLALIGSIMVSYVRARAEGLGIACSVGMMQRAERIVLLSLAALLHEYILMLMIWVVAVFANITAIQRIYHVWRTEQAEIDDERIDESLGI